ncbi:MAG: hypothetical protein NXI20_11045 [bacterium]|jgi:hypothetical protein|nr:hypothetical protein [bacterium]
MIKIIQRVRDFFRKGSEFPKPFFGLSWEEFSGERKRVNKLIKYINDHKVTSGDHLSRNPSLFFLVYNTRKRINDTIDALESHSNAQAPLRKMRAACQKILLEFTLLDTTPKQLEEYKWNFLKTINIQVAVLMNTYWIELDEELPELQINTSLV